MADERDDAMETTTSEPESPPAPRVPSETVGTGSYVAVSCTALMILVTLLLIAGLLIVRWLT
jgi:hypothetical protein